MRSLMRWLRSDTASLNQAVDREAPIVAAATDGDPVVFRKSLGALADKLDELSAPQAARPAERLTAAVAPVVRR